jgi:hypothetical protein
MVRLKSKFHSIELLDPDVSDIQLGDGLQLDAEQARLIV